VALSQWSDPTKTLLIRLFPVIHEVLVADLVRSPVLLRASTADLPFLKA
jgi:hypothetical protein